MGSRVIQQRVDGEDLKDKIKMLLSFFTLSRIYYYGNYTQIRAIEDEVMFTQVQIVGEAVNTGLLEAKVQGEYYLEEDFNITVATEELKRIVNQIPDDVNELLLASNSLTIASQDKEIVIPVVDSDIPRNLMENHEYVRTAPTTMLDIKNLNKSIAQVNQATKGVIVSYDNHAIYLENDSVIVNKGVRVTRHYPAMPLGLTEGLYLPLYMVPVLKHLEDENVQMGRVTTPHGEELVMVKGDSFAIHFQEWFSKEQFPLDSIKQLTALQALVETPEYISTLGDLSTADKVLELDLANGEISTRDKKIVADVPSLVTPKVHISTEVMPKKAELRKYKSIEVGPSMVRFQGPDIVTIVATMEES